MLQNTGTPSLRLPRTGLPKNLRVFFVILLVLGVFFRFVNLDKKVYWHDETFTSLRASGYTEAEAVQQLSNANVISIETLQQYQRPNFERGLSDTLKSLAVEDTQHPPLYYAIASFWIRWFGSSVTAMRSLSVLFSLLALPSIYWLCLELFESSLTGWVAVGLIAVSPYQVMFAQEARQYSLWAMTILLSSAALLRAMRLSNKVNWGIYAVTLAASLNTFLFSGLVAIGHGIYVVMIERWRWSKTLRAYLLASLLGFIGFLPWTLVLIFNLSQAQKTTAWLGNKMTLFSLMREWALNLSRVFIDWYYTSADPSISKILFYLVSLALVALVGYSFYFLYRHTPERIWLFLLTLVGVTAVALIVPDVITGGQRSVIHRYSVACYLGIQLAVAHLIASKIIGISSNIWQHKLWQLVMLLLFSSGVVSCALSSQAEVWWLKDYNGANPAVARLVNQASRPLVISDGQMADILSLGYYLNPNVQLLLRPKCYTCDLKSQSGNTPYIPKISENFSDVVLFHPRYSEEWLQGLKQQKIYQIKPLVSDVIEPFDDLLWRLEKL
ncbi:MAG: glycosyltransferase family 39 protein [Coleofasciculus sp. Co-bin14]|nr:glycosyltransferase family 39 protein [Coleofasciculus sp. Co-bin14]